jgi:hypothetical protein
MALRAILFVQALAAIDVCMRELLTRPGLIVLEVFDALRGKVTDHRSQLRVGRVREKFSGMDDEVLRVLSETIQPVHVVPLAGILKRRTLRTADDLAVLLDCVAAKAGVRLVGHPAEGHLELTHL